MELARAALGLAAQGYRREPRLVEIAFGEWEGFTIAQLHERDPQRIAQREHDKWHFVPPGGESYEMVSARMRDWYESLARDTVVTAHGGTARGLIAHLGIAKPAAAPLLDIEQGVVYVFEGEKLRVTLDLTAARARCTNIAQSGTTMSFNTFGHLFRFTSFGESHGAAIGCVVDGCPPRIPLEAADIQAYLDKRRPGQSRFTTQRQEPDAVKIMSGVFTDEATASR